MPKLDVSATIYPTAVHLGYSDRVLVAVSDQDGGPVTLTRDDVTIYLWASLTDFSPTPALVSLAHLTDLSIPEPGYFYELKLGSVSIPTEDPESLGTAEVPGLGPLVYTVTIATASDHGQAIACLSQTVPKTW
jgi:hypothetical protein